MRRLMDRLRARRLAKESWASYQRMCLDPQLSFAFLKYLDECEMELGRPGTVADLVPWLQQQPATFESTALLSVLVVD